MATLKEFEEALRQHGMTNALAILEGLKKRDREQRSVAPARRVVGKKMTAELARTILDYHATTGMTQQEIAFKLGVNQGRVNEVIKRGKWLSADPNAPEVLSRDKAMDRLKQRAVARRAAPAPVVADPPKAMVSPRPALPVQPESRRVAVERPPAPTRQVSLLPKLDATKPRVAAIKAQAAAVKPPIISAQLAFLDL